jgi:RNA polymerase sigma factor (sigma-70 family)
LELGVSPPVTVFDPTRDQARALPLAEQQTRWFAEQVQPHEADLRAFLRRHFPTVQDIDDLVQEAYVRLIRAHHAGSIAEPRAYLFTTARNLACDLFRRRRPISIEEIEETQRLSVVEDKADAAETASHAQEVEWLIEAIQALPARCREVLTLRKLHGLSYRDIAARLGISENTVNAQLAIGLVRCRQYLAARGVAKLNDDA